MIGLSSNVDTLNHCTRDSLVKSWGLPLGKVNLFWVKNGVIRATILQGDGKCSYISDILGLEKHWMSSSSVLAHVLNDAYAILNQSCNQEFFLRIAPRICGGGHGHSKDSSDDRSGAASSSSERDISHDRQESARTDKAADTKQNTSSDRDITDQSSRSESQRDTASDKQKVVFEEQQSSNSNQESSEKSTRERVNPSPSDFYQYSSKNTESYGVEQAATDVLTFVAEEVVGEVTGLGTVMSFLSVSECNKEEKEWLDQEYARDRAQKEFDKGEFRHNMPDSSSEGHSKHSDPDARRGGADRSDFRDDMPDPLDRDSKYYTIDPDQRREFDRSDFQDNMPDLSDRDSRYSAPDADRRGFDRGDFRDNMPDPSDFRDNMREHAEMYPKE